MKRSELEHILRQHAEIMINNISPFQSETEDIIMNYERTKHQSNFRRSRRILVLAVIAAFLLGTTAFASYGYFGGWFSATDKEYDQLPSQQELTEDVGRGAVIVDSFSNGYIYERGVVDNNEVFSEDMELIKSFKSANFSYTKNGNTVFLTQDCSGYETMFLGDLAANIDGIDLYYYSYANKIVPADYQLSEEEKLAEERGELIFSYGSDSVMLTEVKSVHWLDDGVDTTLMQVGGELSKDDLVQMSIEVIKR